MNPLTQKAVSAFDALCALIKSVTEAGCDEQSGRKLFALERDLATANSALSPHLNALPVEDRHLLQASASELARVMTALVDGLETGKTEVRTKDAQMRGRLIEYYRNASQVFTFMAERDIAKNKRSS